MVHARRTGVKCRSNKNVKKRKKSVTKQRPITSSFVIGNERAAKMSRVKTSSFFFL